MIYLTVQHADGKITYHTLKSPENLIGRHESTQLPIDDRNASNHHARIYLSNSMYWCEDGFGGQPSRNGTWVNGKRIADAVPLEKGDTIFIGATQLTVSDLTVPVYDMTEEIPTLRGKESLQPEEWQGLQLNRLDQEIRKQRWKIQGAAALLLLIVIGVILLLIPGAGGGVSAIRLVRNPKNPVILFSSFALPGRNFVFESPQEGKVNQLFMKKGDKVQQGDMLLEIKSADGKTIPLLSPIDGRLNNWECEAGQQLLPGKPLCRLLDITNIKLYLEIPEKELPPSWQEQQRLKLSFPKSQGLTREGIILNITFRDKLGVPIYEVMVDVPNPEEKVQLGDIVHLEGFLIPTSALVNVKGSWCVYVVEDHRPRLRRVTITQKDAISAVVSAGLEENELVIVTPGKLQEGVPVKVQIEGK